MLNKSHIILLAFLLGFSMLILSPAYSGTQSTWIHEYDGYYNDYPFILYALQQTIEGGYILAGSRYAWCDPCPDSWESFLIIKADVKGNIVWQKTYGYGSTDGEYASSIQQTADRGYIVAGLTTSFGAGNDDIWILKLDSSGNIIWQKTYGRAGDDLPYSIHQTSDGGLRISSRSLWGASHNISKHSPVNQSCHKPPPVDSISSINSHSSPLAFILQNKPPPFF